VIVTYRRPSELARTLESISVCEPPPGEILIVDGDPDRSAESVVRERAQAGLEPRYLNSPPSLSIQRNRGMDAATGDVFVFLDDDVDLDGRVFALLREVYSDPTVVGATGRIIEENPRRFGKPQAKIRRVLFPGGEQGTMTSFGYPRRILDPGRPGDVEWMEGCFSTARAEHARRLRFDENITAELEGEDEDFAYRLSRLGRIRYEPRLVVRHRQLGFRTKAGARRFDRDIVVVRTYLFRKNFRRTLRTRIEFALLILVLLAHRLLNTEWRGALGILDGVVYVWRHRNQPLLGSGSAHELAGAGPKAAPSHPTDSPQAGPN
jgi:glycosyltransferase involved in cell wall biosynthesis